MARQPHLRELLGELLAPAEHEDFAQPVAQHHKAHRERDVTQILPQQRVEQRAVELFQRVVEIFVPCGDVHAHAHNRQRKADDGSQQQPRFQAAFAAPKRAGKLVEMF